MGVAPPESCTHSTPHRRFTQGRNVSADVALPVDDYLTATVTRFHHVRGGEREVPVTNLRERRRHRMMSDIERCALRLFAERGFDAVTVQEIADASDISERTFFRYFPTKEAVLRSELDLRVAELEAALDARPPEEPVMVALRGALLELAERYEADRETVLTWTAVVAAAPSLASRLGAYQHAFSEGLLEFVRERLPVDDDNELDVFVAISAVLAATYAASTSWVEAGARGPLVPMVTRALDLVEGGVANLAAPQQPRRRSSRSMNFSETRIRTSTGGATWTH